MTGPAEAFDQLWPFDDRQSGDFAIQFMLEDIGVLHVPLNAFITPVLPNDLKIHFPHDAHHSIAAQFVLLPNSLSLPVQVICPLI